MHRNSLSSRILSLLLLIAMFAGLIPSGVLSPRAEGSIDDVTNPLSAEAAELMEQISEPGEPAPLAQWFDHTGYRSSSSDSGFKRGLGGSFFVVSVLKDKNGVQRAFALDPTMPSLYGSFAPVSEEPLHRSKERCVCFS